MADRQRGTRLLPPTTSPLWGVAEDFFWKRESPFLPDYSLKGEEDRCAEDCPENCLPGPPWAEELEYGERRDGVVNEEVLRCGLNKDKSRVVEQAVSTDELSPEHLKLRHEATLPQAFEKDFCNWEIVPRQQFP